MMKLTPEQQQIADNVQSNLDESFTKIVSDHSGIKMSKMILETVYNVPSTIVVQIFKMMYDTGTQAVAIEILKGSTRKNQIND